MRSPRRSLSVGTLRRLGLCQWCLGLLDAPDVEHLAMCERCCENEIDLAASLHGVRYARYLARVMREMGAQ